MRLGIAAFGAAALLAVPIAPARAGVYFDTLTGVIPSDYDGRVDSASVIAQSFSAGNPDFTTISLSLSSDSQNSNGSVTVYLAPDDGTGNANGFAGAPVGISASSGTGAAIINPAGYLTLGTVSDSQLPLTSVANSHSGPGNGAGTSVTTFSINPSSIPTTKDREYWVVAVGNSASDYEWFLKKPSAQSTGVTGVGIANQDNGNDAAPDGWGTYNVPTTFVYGMSVTGSSPTDAPEPGTIMLLAAGLLGIGLCRRHASGR